MKKILGIICLLFIGLTTINSQTFGTFSKMEGVTLDKSCATFTVTVESETTDFIVVAADKSGNEITRWYFPANTLQVTRKNRAFAYRFENGLRTYELSRPVNSKK